MDNVEPPQKKARFLAVSDSDIAAAVDAKVWQSTKTATAFWVNIFRHFCEKSRISIDLTTRSPSQLDEALCRFYLGVRNKNGEFYKLKKKK